MMLISYVKSRLLVDMQKGNEQHIVHETDFVFANRSLVGICRNLNKPNREHIARDAYFAFENGTLILFLIGYEPHERYVDDMLMRKVIIDRFSK